jgi:GH25 family lysozyme M1 (1,4-beta-N-acetylmuramidase)
MVDGIDVSGNQGGIDFAKVAATGQANWVYAKATEGVTFDDDHFALYHDACKANNIPFGAYHFLRFNPVDDPVAQAQHFLKAINGRQGQLIPMVDVEVIDNQPTTLITATIASFMAEVEKTLGGKLMLLYTYYSYWNSVMKGSTAFTGHPLWIAEYNSDVDPTLPGGFKDWAIWQFSSSGNVAGIGTSVDLDKVKGNDLTAISR